MTLSLKCNWLEQVARPSKDELDATLAAVRIIIDGRNVTTYTDLSDTVRNRAEEQLTDKLHLPAYFMAEWFAENWWPLLYEPKKTEDASRGSLDFDARHALLSAQHGFALPDVRIEPAGDAVQVGCHAREVPLAGVRFPYRATKGYSRQVVRAVLSDFVRQCAARLAACGIQHTPMQKAWKCVEGTTAEQEIFCRLAGALGMNPYSAGERVIQAISALYDLVGEQAAADLCMASSEEDIDANAQLVSAMTATLNGPHNSTLLPLETLRLPPDKLDAPAWSRGKNAAIAVRKVLGVSSSDHQGADKFFEQLQLDISAGIHYISEEEPICAGGVDRQEQELAVALVQKQAEARRFAACRAIFLGLSSPTLSRRVLTNTVARDQQASRAFAAEMLVPSNYIKDVARRQGLNREIVGEIARERRAGVGAVSWQAVNNGLVIQN